MHAIDWAIVLLMLGGIFLIAYTTRMFMKSVADFLAAGRLAGRYMLCVSEGIAWLGAISVIAHFEMGYNAGFTALWWTELYAPVSLIVALSGWVIYRYRETRALTLAQFFEVRYNKKFRIFAGILAWLSGVINLGIFPAVGARFFIYYCGLPESYSIGPLTLSSYVSIVGGLLFLAVMLLFFSGQIAVMITDFCQGIYTNIVFLVILIFIFLFKFDWSEVILTLIETEKPNASLIHPLKTGDVESFNPWFFIIIAFSLFYNHMAWQGSQGYNAAAKTPHEARMGRILGVMRGIVTTILFSLLPICVYVFFNNSNYAAQAAEVNAHIDQIPNEYLREQARVTMALPSILPKGLVGAFAALMLAAAVSTLDTYLHSWGSIFIQDVILPFRKKPFSTKQHLLVLRLSILLVAVIVFFWSVFYRQTEHIFLYFAVTGAIFLGGAGSVIIGGLYWKYGKTSGAFAAMIVGAVLSLGKVILDQRALMIPLRDYVVANFSSFTAWLDKFMVDRFPSTAAEFGPFAEWEKIPIDGQWMYGIAMVSAILVYVIVSLIVKGKPCNLEKILHRGKYAVQSDHTSTEKVKKPKRGLKALGINDEFTRWDKVIYFFTMGWMMFWVVLFWVGTAYGMFFETSYELWANFWSFKCWLMLFVGIFVTFWFAIGGIRDMIDMLKGLRSSARDINDDGMIREEDKQES